MSATGRLRDSTTTAQPSLGGVVLSGEAAAAGGSGGNEMEQLASFIVNTAECRTPLVMSLEDLPPFTTPHDMASLLARMGEVPLLSFELLHTDDRIAGRRILEAIQSGSWLLFHIPSVFHGVESLLRDLGRRLFTITPNDATRPLMGRFRLIIAMSRNTPSSTVFRKLAIPLPIHPNMVVRQADVNEYIRLEEVDTRVTDCVVGAMFYRATELNGSDKYTFEVASQSRPVTAYPFAHRERRERHEKARPSSALTTSVLSVTSSAPRVGSASIAGRSNPSNPPSGSPTRSMLPPTSPQHGRGALPLATTGPRASVPLPSANAARGSSAGPSGARPTVLSLHRPDADPYEAERAMAERELFERHASDVSQKVFGFLMRRYYNMGDAEARQLFHPFNSIVGLPLAEAAGEGPPAAKSITKDVRSASQPSSLQAPARKFPTVPLEEEEGFVADKSSAAAIGGPHRASNHYGMRKGEWRGTPVWAVGAYPCVGPTMPPLATHREVLCTVHHPSLLSPMAQHKGLLLYRGLPDPATLSINTVNGAVRAVWTLATGLLALRDGGFAHRNISLASLVTVGSDEQHLDGSGSASIASGGKVGRAGRPHAPSSPDAFRLLVTNQAAPYAPNANGLLVADCGVCSRIYMSPEAIRTGEWTYADDAWAVGVILWQLLMRVCEFGEKDALEQLTSSVSAATPVASTNASHRRHTADPFADLESEHQVAALVASDGFDPLARFPLPKAAPAGVVLVWNMVGRQCLALDPTQRMTLTQLVQRLPR